MTERFARGLAEFAELCMVSARDLVAAQVAATDPAEKANCASSLHKVGRSLRQCMALEAKLRRDEEIAPRERLVQAAQAEQDRRILRKAQVCATVARLIWTEARSDEEGERLLHGLSLMVDEECLGDGFGDEPLEDHIERVCQKLGLISGLPPAPEPPRAGHEAEDEAEDEAEAEDDYWRSSA